jgi:hypothetical protein
LFRKAGKKFARIDTMCGIVGTSINTVGFIVFRTEIACGRFCLYLGNFSARMRQVVYRHLEGLHINVAVGAVVSTKATADAPVLNGDFQAIAPSNRPNRASHHAQGVLALATGSGHEIVVKTQTVANQAADTIVGVGTGAHTLITARAFFQVKDQKTLRFHQTLRKKGVNGNVLYLRKSAAIFRDAVSDNQFQAAANVGKTVQHKIEVFDSDTHCFYVIEGNAVGCADACTEKGKFTEKPTAADVRQNQLSTGVSFRYFDEADSNQKETVRRIALAANELTRRILPQLNAVAQVGDKLGRHRREDGNAAQVGL